MTSVDEKVSQEGHDGLPSGKAALYAALAFLVIGIGIAIHLVGIKLDILQGGAGNAGCTPSATVDCGTVNASAYSSIGPVPIALLAIPTYFLLGYLIMTALRVLGSSEQQVRRKGALSLEIAAVIGLLTCAYSIYLFYVSKAVIGKICPYCIALYGVNIVTTIILIAAGPRSILKSIFNVFESIKPILPAAGVFIIGAGISWMWYDGVRSEGAEANKQRSIAAAEKLEKDPEIQARIEARKKEQAAAAAQAAKTRANKPKTVATAKTGVRNCKPIDPSKAVRMGKPSKPGDGYPYFETPLDQNCEFWAGNPEAKVTVVKYADFQCAYCKILDSAMKRVKKKYGDKVRFVMKHFPMNVKCNPRMRGYDKHPYACEAAYSGHCAGLQGKFWEMHDAMYARQKDLEPGLLRQMAEQIGLNLGDYDACLTDPKTAQAIRTDIAISYRAGIWGTPKTYINDRLVTGAASASVLEYHIKRALQGKGPGKAKKKKNVVMAPKPDGTQMIQAKTGSKTFYIDPYESVLDKSGKAVMSPGAEPAQVDWYTAKKACEAAGKRLCTEEEWISACTSTPAVDNNGNGWFSDDDVEGEMYPYGPFYEPGACQDKADKYNGKAVGSGTKAKCRTASGIFDLTGNIGEWVNADPKKATLMGGNAASGERAACNQRSYGRGLGRRNHTTGMRCCADTNVRSKKVQKSQLKTESVSLLNRPMPAFTAKDQNGKVYTVKSLKGKVTLINFFASWCGPCKKEFPYLVNYLNKFKSKGFQILAFGEDSQAERSYEFAKKYGANFSIAHDEESKLMGLFRVYSMPTTYLVDRKGIVRYMDTGFKPAEQAEKLKQAIEDLL